MKSDFEKELERRPLRKLPEEWRREILAVCQASARGLQPPSQISRDRGQEGRVWWRELFWPCPQAWAGLAVVWVIIIGLHLIAGSEAGSSAQFAATPASAEWRAALDEQR